MSDPVPPAAGPAIKRENYVRCPQCTKELGEAVLYHKSQLKDDRFFGMGDERWTCPEGHPIDLKGDAA